MIVTHDGQVAELCQRIARIERGHIVADERMAHPKDASEVLAQLSAATAA